MHDVADKRETRAKLAAGMEHAEILRREAARLQQGHRERIAHGELHGRRGGRRETVRAGLLRLGQAQADIRLAAERGFRVRRDRHERNGEAPRIGDDIGEFRGLA